MELLRLKASSVNFKIKIIKTLIKLVVDLKRYIKAQVYCGRHYQETTHLGKSRIRAGRKEGPRKCRSPKERDPIGRPRLRWEEGVEEEVEKKASRKLEGVITRKKKVDTNM